MLVIARPQHKASCPCCHHGRRSHSDSASCLTGSVLFSRAAAHRSRVKLSRALVPSEELLLEAPAVACSHATDRLHVLLCAGTGVPKHHHSLLAAGSRPSAHRFQIGPGANQSLCCHF